MFSYRKGMSKIGLAALALALCSCAGVKPLTAVPPHEEPFRTELKREISTLNVAMETTADDLAKTLNRVIDKELYQGSTGTRGVTARITRNGPIAVSAADNYLFLSVPVSISLSYATFSPPSMATTLKFKLAARVTPDWKIDTEVYYTGLSDQLVDKIGIGPLSIKPRSIVEEITQPVQKRLSRIISDKISEKYPLKPEVAKAWQAIQKPILLNREYSAWLKVIPQEALLYPPTAQNNRVRFSVGITSYAALVVGPEPPSAPPVPLPKLRLVNSFDRKFRIALNTDIYFRDLLRAASPRLLGKDFGADGRNVVLKGLDVYGNGDRMIVRIETAGSLDGVFYLTCRPGFNPQTRVFSLDDVDFEMQTEDLLLHSADWFLHGTIKSGIQEKINMDLTQRLEQSRDLAQKAVARVKLADHLFLKGTITDLKFSDAVVQKDRISIQVYTEGETEVVFQ
jgi:uncharacterized protein DUF4403